MTSERISVYLCGFKIKKMFTKNMRKKNSKHKEKTMVSGRRLFLKVIALALVPTFISSSITFAQPIPDNRSTLAPASRTDAVDDSNRGRGDVLTNTVAKNFTDQWFEAYGSKIARKLFLALSRPATPEVAEAVVKHNTIGMDGKTQLRFINAVKARIAPTTTGLRMAGSGTSRTATNGETVTPPGNIKLLVARNKEAMAREMAERIVVKVREANRAGQRMTLGLATGGTMERVYELVVEITKNERLDWSGVVTFNLDEYKGLLSTHKQSYRAFMDKHLFTPLVQFGLKIEDTHVFDGTASVPDDELRKFLGMIKRHGGVDLQILGIGSDGHYAFHEPAVVVDDAMASAIYNGELSPEQTEKVGGFNEFIITGKDLAAKSNAIQRVIHAKSVWLTALESNESILAKVKEAWTKEKREVNEADIRGQLRQLGKKLLLGQTLHFYIDGLDKEAKKNLLSHISSDELYRMSYVGRVELHDAKEFFDSKAKVVDLALSTIIDNSRYFPSLLDVPTQAYTLTGVVREAKEILLAASGENKAEAIAGALGKTISQEVTSSILQTHPNTTFIIAEDALTKVPSEVVTKADKNRVFASAARSALSGYTREDAKREVPVAFAEHRAFCIGEPIVENELGMYIPSFNKWTESDVKAFEETLKDLPNLEGIGIDGDGKAALTIKKEKFISDSQVLTGLIKFLFDWAQKREEREKSEAVSNNEVLAAFKDLVNSIALIRTSIGSMAKPEIEEDSAAKRYVLVLDDTQAPATVDQLKKEARLTAMFTGIEPPIHYEYGRGTPWVGFTGSHAGAASIYTSVARTKQYVKLIEEAVRDGHSQYAELLKMAFIQSLSGNMEAKNKIVETIIVAEHENDNKKALEKIKAEDKDRFTETFVSVDLSRALGQLAQIPEAIAKSAENYLLTAIDKGEINDFVVKRFGELLIFDVTHNNPIYDIHLRAQEIIAASIREAFAEVIRLGYYKIEQEKIDFTKASLQELAKALDWNTDEIRYTKGQSNKRKSQPTMRQFIFGADERAFNSILFNLYGSPNITTMQAIEGSAGIYFKNQKVADLRRDSFTRLVRGEALDTTGRNEIAQHLPRELFKLVNLNKGPDPDFGSDSGYATKAIYSGKESRFPQDEPMVVVMNLGKVQVAVYQSQAGAEAVGGILGVGVKEQSVDGLGGDRQDLRPVTWEEAASQTLDSLKGRKIAPTTFTASQMNRGRFGEVIDPVKESPEFRVRNLARKVKGEIDFEEVYRAHWPIQPGTNAVTAEDISAKAWNELKEQGSAEEDVVSIIYGKLKKEKRVKMIRRWKDASENREEFTMSVFKADIGSSLGHTIPPKLLMTLIRAYLEYAKAKGWIQDYLVQKELPMFRVGDDIEIVISHKKGIEDSDIHRLAVRAFYFALYFADAAKRDEYYGFGQDLPLDVDYFLAFAKIYTGEDQQNTESFVVDKSITSLMEDYVKPRVEALSREDRYTITQAEISAVYNHFNNAYMELKTDVYQSKKETKIAAGATGNVSGSGIGFAELSRAKLAPGRSYTFFAFDKASPGAFSLPYYEAALVALRAGDYDNLSFEVEVVKPLDKHEIGQKIMLIDVAEQPELLKNVLSSVNDFQIKAVWTKDRDGSFRMVAANSTERLYQSEKAHGAYLGKDDPAAMMEQAFANRVIEWMAANPYIIQGDERGSHMAFVLLTSATQSSPGTFSIPVAVAVSFTLGLNGELRDIIDVFGAPKFELPMAKAVAANELYIERHGNNANRGEIGLIEESYPGRRLHRKILKDANPALSIGEIMAERGRQAASGGANEAVAGGWLYDKVTVPDAENLGDTLRVIKASSVLNKETDNRVLILALPNEVVPSDMAVKFGQLADRYLGTGAVQIIRANQDSLYGKAVSIAGQVKQAGKEAIVVSMVSAGAGESVVNDLARLGKVMKIADGSFVSPGFVDLALRIAYGTQGEVLACLNRIATHEKGLAFSEEDIARVFKGLVIILPRAGSVDLKTAREAYTAAKKYIDTSL